MNWIPRQAGVYVGVATVFIFYPASTGTGRPAAFAAASAIGAGLTT